MISTPFSFIPFLTGCVICFSKPPKISLAPSRMVTSEPKLANAVPNSDPMYPPPTTTNLPGTSCKFKAPVESITRLPNLKLGISIGLEPVAMIASLSRTFVRSFRP